MVCTTVLPGRTNVVPRRPWAVRQYIRTPVGHFGHVTDVWYVPPCYPDVPTSFRDVRGLLYTRICTSVVPIRTLVVPRRPSRYVRGYLRVVDVAKIGLSNESFRAVHVADHSSQIWSDAGLMLVRSNPSRQYGNGRSYQQFGLRIRDPKGCTRAKCERTDGCIISYRSNSRDGLNRAANENFPS